MSLVDNNSLSIVPHVSKNSAIEQPRLYVKECLKARAQSVMKDFSAYMRSLENLYLNTYKALHLGVKETLESRMIRSTVASFQHF